MMLTPPLRRMGYDGFLGRNVQPAHEFPLPLDWHPFFVAQRATCAGASRSPSSRSHTQSRSLPSLSVEVTRSALRRSPAGPTASDRHPRSQSVIQDMQCRSALPSGTALPPGAAGNRRVPPPRMLLQTASDQVPDNGEQDSAFWVISTRLRRPWPGQIPLQHGAASCTAAAKDRVRNTTGRFPYWGLLRHACCLAAGRPLTDPTVAACPDR